MRVLVNGTGSAAYQDVEWRVRLCCLRLRTEAGRLEDGLQFASPHDSIHLWNILADLIAVPLHQAARNDQPLSLAAICNLVLDHLQNRIYRLLLGRVDKTTGVDDENLRVLGTRGKLPASAMQQAHHDFGIDQVFRAAE